MKKVVRTVVIIFLINSQMNTNAQMREEDYPIIGKPCPTFKFDSILYYSKQKVTLDDFKGKWLILDFWSRYCLSCFQSFPEINKLRHQFQGKIEFVMIGYHDKYIRTIYERFRKKLDLQLPVVYDTVLFQRFRVNSVPHVIWIDPKGAVRAITFKDEVNAQNIQDFLDGKDLTFAEKFDAPTQEENKGVFDHNKPLLINGNGGNDTDFLFRSILAQWKPNIDTYFDEYLTTVYEKRNQVSLTGISLSKLYQIAYFDTIVPIPLNGRNNYGKYWLRPILEIVDTSDFEFNYKNGKNIYCYNLIMPLERASKFSLQQIMKRDLKNYFGYDVKIMDSVMPCWRLVATEEAKIKLKTKNSLYKGNNLNYLMTFELKNQPIYELIRALWAMHQDEPPFIDDTGIKGNVDLIINNGTYDLTEVIPELRKNGMDLIKDKRLMKILVIGNKKVD
jgi:thiol-disulfide isomerase/thioredoxin